MSGKRVLLIAYHFPPVGGPAVGRPVALCKYLPQYGYHCDVLTVKDVASRVQEPDLLKDIAPSRIFRSGSYDPQRLMRLLGIHKVRDAHTDRGKKAAQRFFPDSQVGWVRQAVKLGRTLSGSNHYDVIFSTSPPISNHLVARQLSTELHIPWVADFRDFWTRQRAEQSYSSQKQIERALRLLKEIQADAAGVTAASPSIGKYVGADSVIYNSYDDDLAGLWKAPADSSRFVFGALGTMNVICPIRPLLEVLSVIRERSPKLFRMMHVVQVGRVDKEWLMKQLYEYQMTDQFEIHEFQPRDKSIQLLNKSALLYLSLGFAEDRGVIPGRLFTLLASGRPILASVPPASDIEQLLTYTNAGIAFWRESVSNAVSYVSDSAESFLSGNANIDPLPENCRPFASKILAKQFASLFDQILS